jgi:sigma-E factor negative regulatory protein RseB
MTLAAMKHTAALLLLALTSSPAQSAEALPKAEATAWLQKIANAAYKMSYQGYFTLQIGDEKNAPAQTLMVTNQPSPRATDNTIVSRLVTLDGSQREIRCTQRDAFTMKINGAQMQVQKRLSNRHFPDLLPTDVSQLANWYGVRLGSTSQVAGHDCTNIEITPKDAFRWGYVMCIDNRTGFPVRAVLVNEAGEPLMQYRFTELKLGASVKVEPPPFKRVDAAPLMPNERIIFSNLPPGFSRIAATRGKLQNHPVEVEHWVFSDGLSHVSLFLEPSKKPVDVIKGQSKQGLVNMMKRPVGDWKATVLGEAPMATVEAISMGLQARP